MVDNNAEEEEEEAEADLEALSLRSNFDPLANFTPSVTLDASGKASIPISIPDNLTRYRIWAVAASADGRSYGIGDNLITARLPITVRASPPRFLNHGDVCEFPVAVQNLTDKPVRIRYAPFVITNSTDLVLEESTQSLEIARLRNTVPLLK